MSFNDSLASWFGRGWPFCLGLAVAYLATGLIPGVGGAMPAPAVGVDAPLQRDELASQIQVIRNMNILLLDNPAKEAAALAGKAPSSWLLLGIIDSAKPMAFLKIESKAITVAVGQEIEGWTLVDISSTQVVFAKGRDEQALSLFKETPQIELSTGKRNKVALSQSEAQGVLNDPNALLQTALFKPSMRGGKMEGFRITNIKDRSILNKLGLEDGDVLVRVNGEAIDGPAKMMQVYSGLQSSRAVTMNVRRGDKLLTLVVEIR